MRKPTPEARQLAWWRDALAGCAQQTEFPECGYFKIRQKAWSKVWLPARIWLHQEIDWTTGELTEPERHVLEISGRLWTDEYLIQDRWLRLRPVTVDEWKWLTARQALHGMPQHPSGDDFSTLNPTLTF